MLTKSPRKAPNKVSRRTGQREPPKNVKHYVTWLLSRRDYSEQQLRRKLQQRNVPQEAADEAIACVQEFGAQDDNRYATHRASSLSVRLGNRRVAADLQSKGIAADIISDKLDSVEPEIDRAIRVSQKFEGQPLDRALQSKIWRFMATRGFSSSSIKGALAHLQQLAPSPVMESEE